MHILQLFEKCLHGNKLKKNFRFKLRYGNPQPYETGLRLSSQLKIISIVYLVINWTRDDDGYEVRFGLIKEAMRENTADTDGRANLNRGNG